VTHIAQLCRRMQRRPHAMKRKHAACRTAVGSQRLDAGG
jgi:hypothetical protein